MFFSSRSPVAAYLGHGIQRETLTLGLLLLGSELLRSWWMHWARGAGTVWQEGIGCVAAALAGAVSCVRGVPEAAWVSDRGGGVSGCEGPRGRMGYAGLRDGGRGHVRLAPCVCVCACSQGRGWGLPWVWALSPVLGRAGVRLGDAETPVLLRGQQQAPGARGPYPEHLVPAAGAGAPEPV